MTSVIPKTLTRPFSPHPILHYNPHFLSHTKLKLSRAMSSAQSQRIFQLKFDPLTGNSEWVVVEDSDDPSERSSTVNLATTSYLDMLNDSYRNKAYRLAIERTITQPCHVLDIGAGTGLLSMMAARAMGVTSNDSNDWVTACESYLPMVKLMRKVLRCNGLERKIKIINKRSDELKVGVDISTRADILVSEILDSELLGEGLIPTLQNAYDELLVENPQTVPYRATTYGQLVESKFLWRLHDLYHNEVSSSADPVRLVPTELASILSVKPQQYPMHVDSLKEDIKLLSEPFKVFEFEFRKRPDSHGDTEQLIIATADGRVHAVVSWWVLQLDQEGTIFYSTAPQWIKMLHPHISGGGNWCDHWKQCVWFVPGKGLSVSTGEDVRLHAVHSDISISYDFNVQHQRADNGHSFNNQDFQLILSPEIIATYSDNCWRNCVLSAVQNALQGKDSPVCYVADDSVFLATAIFQICLTSQIMLLFPGLREKGFQYLKAIAEVYGLSVDRLKLLDHQKDCITIHDYGVKKVDLLVGEPFYCGCEAQLPWKNLRFWRERTRLEGVLAKDARIIPCRGILRVCAMFLPDLWRSRQTLENIEGFDHSAINATLGACGNLPLPQESLIFPFFVWQCGKSMELSERCTLMEFDFSKPMISCTGKVKVEFTNIGICHGFALWMDWVLDTENGISVSTGPDNRYWKQGVKLISQPVAIGSQDLIPSDKRLHVELEANFDSSTGDLIVRHSFLQ